MRPMIALLLLLTASVALVACDDGDDNGAATPTATSTPAPTETETPEATDTPTATPTSTTTPEATDTPSPSPSAAPGDRRTGIEGVDAVIDAVVADDVDAVAALLAMRTLECTTAQGAGGPPKCQAGEAEGTPVEVFPYGSCELEFVRDPQQAAERFLMQVEGEPYAVTTAPAPPQSEADLFGYGEYQVIFEMADPALGGGMAAFVEDGEIVYVASLCQAAPEDFLAWPNVGELEVILPPPDGAAAGATSGGASDGPGY